MPRTGRPTARITLSDDERAELERWSRRARSARRLALRAKLILASAAGADDTAVGAQFRTKPHTVGFWRKRFLRSRLNGLVDEPRPGAPRKITDDKVEEVVVAALETTPEGEPMPVTGATVDRGVALEDRAGEPRADAVGSGIRDRRSACTVHLAAAL